MGFSVETSVSAVTVFLQGALSFFSPCVLPLVPLYVSYLAGGAAVVGEDGIRRYPRGKIFLNTLFFVVGISFAFFLLGLGLTALGAFFSQYQVWFARASGVIILLFGLYQLGLGRRSMVLEQEHRLPFRLDKLAMNPAVALLLGFTFSFAWTPCVGPTLSSVLLMASSGSSAAAGFLLIGVYTLGFVLPFLAVGLFTGTVLDFFKSHQSVVRYTVKIGAVLLIVMGILTLTGAASGISADLAAISGTVQETPAAPAGGRLLRRTDGRRGRRGPVGGGERRGPCAPRPGLHPDGPVRKQPHALRLQGTDGVPELLGHLVRPLQDGDAGHPGPLRGMGRKHRGPRGAGCGRPRHRPGGQCRRHHRLPGGKRVYLSGGDG